MATQAQRSPAERHIRRWLAARPGGLQQPVTKGEYQACLADFLGPKREDDGDFTALSFEELMDQSIGDLQRAQR